MVNVIERLAFPLAMLSSLGIWALIFYAYRLLVGG